MTRKASTCSASSVQIQFDLDHRGALRHDDHAFEAATDKDAARAKRVAEFKEKFANPYVAAARGFVDEVIRPRQTRARLIAALATLDAKRDKNPPKKHGNIPL